MPKLKPIGERLVRRDTEAGQAIVIVALFMLVLVGMLGLAIDGGGLFLLYRDARNAADTAALQAAYARCTSPVGSPEYKTVGLNAADENGFRNGSISTVTVTDYGDVTNISTDVGNVYVKIVATKPSYFAQLVFTGPLTIEVEAVAFCDRGYDPESNPGAIARAPDSVCNANAANSVREEFTFRGSDIYFDGTMYTNGSFGVGTKTWMQSPDSHFYYYGVFQGKQDVHIADSRSDVGNTSLPNATSGSAGPNIDPEDFYIFDLDPSDTQIPEAPGTTVNLIDYIPGGDVYDYIDTYNNTTTGVQGYAVFIDGDLTNPSQIPAEAKGSYTGTIRQKTGGNYNNNYTVKNHTFLRGLIVVRGDITLAKNDLAGLLPEVQDTFKWWEDGNDWDEDDFVDAFTGLTSANGLHTDVDWPGVTFVAIPNTDTGSLGTIDIKLGAGMFHRFYEGFLGFEGNVGLADEIDSNYSSVLVATEAATLGKCQDYVIDYGASGGASGGYAYGLIWSPNGGMNINFSGADFRGALDAYMVEYTGATSRFWYDPSLIAPRNPSTGQSK